MSKGAARRRISLVFAGALLVLACVAAGTGSIAAATPACETPEGAQCPPPCAQPASMSPTYQCPPCDKSASGNAPSYQCQPCGPSPSGSAPATACPPPCGTDPSSDCPPPCLNSGASCPPCGAGTDRACIEPEPLTMSGLAATPGRFQATGRPASARGTKLSFQLSRIAYVRFAFSGPVARRRVCRGRGTSRRCRIVTRAPFAGKFTIGGAAGANTVPFSGRLAGRTLRPGRYHVGALALSGSERVRGGPIDIVVVRPAG